MFVKSFLKDPYFNNLMRMSPFFDSVIFIFHEANTGLTTIPVLRSR